MRALIPAAGLGTRWYPWSKVVPKELLPLGQYPAIHYVLEEAVAAGTTEIGIIISEAKKLIRMYVENVWQVQRPKERIVWFYQTSPRGVANALLCAKEWVGDKPTSVLYPDEIHPSEGGIIQLRSAYEDFPASYIGLTANKQDRRQAVLKIEKIGENIFHVNEFRKDKSAQQIGYGTGRYILHSGLSYLGDYLPQVALQQSEELDDDKILQPLWEKSMCGTMLSEPIFDIGIPTNWLCTIANFCTVDLKI
ncbi:MAG: sugar phosphate nucleotidyltransferase [Thermodesulfobacteriota bacterium]|nr:sugar phosphate nucleotidyltransferase [Thermodesulfobacteriota bacterium]